MGKEDLIQEPRRQFLEAYQKLLELRPFFNENAEQWFVIERPPAAMKGKHLANLFPIYLSEFEEQVARILSPEHREQQILEFISGGLSREEAETWHQEPEVEIQDFTSMYIMDMKRALEAKKVTSKQAAELRVLELRLRDIQTLMAAGIERQRAKKKIQEITKKIERIKEDLKRSH